MFEKKTWLSVKLDVSSTAGQLHRLVLLFSVTCLIMPVLAPFVKVILFRWLFSHVVVEDDLSELPDTLIFLHEQK